MNQLLSLIQETYPDDYHKIQQAISHTLNKQRLTRQKPEDWYKRLQFYVVYPDTFHSGWKAGLDELADKIGYIKRLGCNAIHVLPFLSSPQIDAGFDVNEYYLVRENLGGNLALDRFLAECEKQDIAVFMDLVLNHVSYQHRWFSQAVSGDRFYRKFFYTSWDQPKLLKSFEDSTGSWASYETDEGQLDIRIIFPEQAGEIPHWVQAEDGYWYYHTFYPQQLDVNWNNYHVFVAYAKVLSFWAKKGVNFRLDAVPFVGKEIKPGLIETSPRTHQLVSAMKQITQTVAPDSVFLVEANQEVDQTIAYFGDPQTKRVESDMAYNFPLMNHLWGALVSGKPDSLAKCLGQTQAIPEWASWVTFLRNHDELTLEFAGKDLWQMLYQQLIDKGVPFRGDHDIAGRTKSLLGDDPEELVFAYFTLASLPWCPAIIYGDEIGKLNDPEFMKSQTEYKQAWFHLEEIADDTRDINRGFLDEAQLAEEQAQAIYKKISQIFKTRLKLVSGKELVDKRIKSESLLCLEYDQLAVYLNFGSSQIEIEYPGGDLKLAAGKTRSTKSKIVLGPRSGVWVS